MTASSMLLRRNRTDGKLQVLFFPGDDPSDSFHQEHMPVPIEGNYLEKKEAMQHSIRQLLFSMTALTPGSNYKQ